MKNLCRVGLVCLFGLLTIAPQASTAGPSSAADRTAQRSSAPPSCPDCCTTSTTCGPSTYSGYFVDQKPNGACVYECLETKQCTERTCCPLQPCVDATYPFSDNYRVRPTYPWGQCPQDQATINAFCEIGRE